MLNLCFRLLAFLQYIWRCQDKHRFGTDDLYALISSGAHGIYSYYCISYCVIIAPASTTTVVTVVVDVLLSSIVCCFPAPQPGGFFLQPLQQWLLDAREQQQQHGSPPLLQHAYRPGCLQDIAPFVVDVLCNVRSRFRRVGVDSIRKFFFWSNGVFFFLRQPNVTPYRRCIFSLMDYAHS